MDSRVEKQLVEELAWEVRAMTLPERFTSSQRTLIAVGGIGQWYPLLVVSVARVDGELRRSVKRTIAGDREIGIVCMPCEPPANRLLVNTVLDRGRLLGLAILDFHRESDELFRAAELIESIRTQVEQRITVDAG